MKGGSREAKELKSRGGENMLRETGDSNPPLPPPPPPNSFLEFREHLRTDNVGDQISVHISAPNRGLCSSSHLLFGK